ncbi:hypothetical protein CBQ28_03230 [Pseudoalteromonas sp. GCY]|uniref:hypothetical protein n=1 Tax=Pseudoalteromonas sp. GCY TaxID=2003316 RepID=UPI000BFF14F0|nr:hypothetical protein [Pseudoalteromonas sp. GCY]PHI38542.1 hypothetical protein CBQ28_03230 [Pseudoalteromonas sp. GCY]QQQ67639.1 hypothetical protein JJQ94_07435 [Pseudoalteromonas sp. GCY]
MVTFNTRLLAMALACSSTSVLATQIFYDQDGAGDHSQYQGAPVDFISARAGTTEYFNALTGGLAADECHQFEVVNTQTGDLIAPLTFNAPFISGPLPAEHKLTEKSVKLSCTLPSGEEAIVYHKIPKAPAVVWHSEITVADWQTPSNAPGYFADVQYTGLININNNSHQGQCRKTNYVSGNPEFFNERHHGGFYSDVLNVVGEAKYSGFYKVLVTELICKNSGGTTRLVETWHINQNSQSRELSSELF